MNSLHMSADLLPLLALLELCSVTEAARRLGLSQPAMSHALARLRARYQDPLLVRSGRSLVRTVRAEAMLPHLRQARAALEAAERALPAFDPSQARRRFSLGTTDYIELVLLPRLMRRLGEEAPGIDLLVSHPADAEAALLGGGLDLACRPLRDRPAAGLRSRALLRERFVCLMSPDHPLRDGPWTPASFAQARHALVAPGGQPGGVVDLFLDAQGLRRRTVLMLPSFLAAPYIVAESDLIVTLAERVARAVARPLGLTLRPPPIEVPDFSMHLIWHERDEEEPGHRWFRGLVGACAREDAAAQSQPT